MSDWRQVGDLKPSLVQTREAAPVTPNNYYDSLNSNSGPDSDSDSNSDSNSDDISITSSAFLPDFWEGLQNDSDPDPSDSDDSTDSTASYNSIDDYNMVE